VFALVGWLVGWCWCWVRYELDLVWLTVHFSHQKKAPNSHGWVNPRDVEEMWMDRFKFFYRENEEGFVYPVTVHPDVCGHPHGLMMLER
jgi:hypothetical protein